MRSLKITTRYNQFLIPAITLLFIVSTTGSYFLIRKTLQNELDEVLLRSKSRIKIFVKQNGHLPQISVFNDQQVHFEKIKSATGDTGLSSATQFIPEQNKNHISRRLVFNLWVNGELYKAVISQPLEGTRHLTIIIAKIAIVAISISFLIFLLINRFVLRKIWRPFYQSLVAMKEFRINEHDKILFPTTSIEEFQMMNDHFSLVAANARKEYKNLKEFSENASHEIQTPLAIIRSNLELLLQEPLTENQTESVRQSNLAVGKLSNMQKALLLLTKIENHQFPQKTDIHVDQELKNKIEEFSELWRAKQIRFKTELCSSQIIANKDLFEILLNNLFSNATRHNVREGSISIYSTNNGFEISNTGINGALDEELVFTRFYKTSPNGNQNGLGLSITKEICNVSGIRISYHHAKNQHHFSLAW